MGTDLITILKSHAQRISHQKGRAEQDLKNGYVVEPIPKPDWPFWFKILEFFSRLIGITPSPPTRKRPMSESECGRIREKIGEFENILSQIKIELSRARQSPELRPIPPGLIDRDDGYPDDWEQISLQYRRKVGFICENCGVHAPDGHVHHIVSVSKGGSSSEDNLAFLCKICHSLHHSHIREY